MHSTAADASDSGWGSALLLTISRFVKPADPRAAHPCERGRNPRDPWPPDIRSGSRARCPTFRLKSRSSRRLSRPGKLASCQTSVDQTKTGRTRSEDHRQILDAQALLRAR
jgi:hypothetical protein